MLSGLVGRKRRLAAPPAGTAGTALSGSEEILLRRAGPDAYPDAVVAADGRDVFFALRPNCDRIGFRPRACWVRNLALSGSGSNGPARGPRPAPPRRLCRYPGGLAIPRCDDLEVVWFTGGDGAALFDERGLAATIPDRAGTPELPMGYARDTRGQPGLIEPLAGEMLEHYRQRAAAARAFWASFGGPADPFIRQATVLRQAYERCFGPVVREIDPGLDRWTRPWFARRIYAFAAAEAEVLLTAGMSIRPQPRVDRPWPADPAPARVELGICLAAGAPPRLRRRCLDFLESYSVHPWWRHDALAAGQAIAWDFGYDTPDEFSTVLLLSAPPGCPALELPAVGNARVGVLWLVLLTAREAARFSRLYRDYPRRVPLPGAAGAQLPAGLSWRQTERRCGRRPQRGENPR